MPFKAPSVETPLGIVVTSLTVNAITMIICAVMAKKIFTNLFGFDFRCGCCIIFKDKHNWIVSPSSMTRITAILSLVLYTLSACSAMCFDIFNIIHPDNKTPGLYAEIISPAFKILARVCYYFYMLSTLKSQLIREPLFLRMMPKHFLYIISIVIVSDIILCSIFAVFFIGYAFRYFHDFNMSLFAIIYQSYHALCDLFATVTLFALYTNGLSKINQWWYSVRDQDYNQYGESQKMHELLILITRCSVICCVTMVTNIVLIICAFIRKFIFMNTKYIPISNIVHTVILNIDIISFSLAVYIVFDFGYEIYRKVCGSCHERLNKICQNRYENGGQKEYVLMNDIDQSVNS